MMMMLVTSSVLTSRVLLLSTGRLRQRSRLLREVDYTSPRHRRLPALLRSGAVQGQPVWWGHESLKPDRQPSISATGWALSFITQLPSIPFRYGSYRQCRRYKYFTSVCLSFLHDEMNKHPVFCEAQLALKCLFAPTFPPGDFYLRSRLDWSSFWCAIGVY